MLTEENLEISYIIEDIPIDSISLEDNERKTINKATLEELAHSIADKGVLKPVLVERVNNNYKLIAGQRRFLASIMAEKSTIKARVYTNLTEEQRYEMQVAENIWSEETPKSENAEFLWKYYLFLLGKEAGGEIGARNYWTIKDPIKGHFTLADFSRKIGKPSSTIERAFRFIRLTPELKKLVKKRERENRKKDGKKEKGMSYTLATEIARIKLPEQQKEIYRRLRRRDKLKYGFGKEITTYLEERTKSPQDFSLEPPTQTRHRSSNTELAMNIGSNTNLIRVLERLIEVEPTILNYGGVLRDNSGPLEEVIKGFGVKLKKTESEIRAASNYLSELETMTPKRRRSLRDILLSGELPKGKSQTHEDYIRSRVIKKIPVGLVFSDENQPRKSFSRTSISGLAESIKVIGQLEPGIIRKTNGKYILVDGERRLRAVKRAGKPYFEAIIVDIDTDTARKIQADANIYEAVALAERATKLSDLYELKKQKEGKEYTMAQFARELPGLGIYAIMDALRFANLPPKIKDLYSYGVISYGLAVRLASIKAPEEQFELILQSTIGCLDERDINTRKPEKEFLPLNIDFKEIEREGRRKLLRDRIRNNLHNISPLPPNSIANKRVIERFYDFSQAYKHLIERINQIQSQN